MRGSVIMKNRNTRISGDVTSTRQSSHAGDRAEMPGGRHLVVARREDGDPGREGQPEADRDPEEVQSREDREPAAHDQRDRDREPDRHRSPPERERVGALRPDEQEAEDEPEVRRVEDVPSAEGDHVLREQGDGGRPGEDPPAVQAPPVAVLGPRHAEHERHAVPGQERARRPHDHALSPERDPDLEDRAREQRDEDLRDREVEVERRLPEDLQRHDHAREVQARVAQRRQQHGVRRAADPHRRPFGSHCGGAHRATMLRAKRRYRAQKSSNAAGSEGSARTSWTRPASIRNSSTWSRSSRVPPRSPVAR